MRLLGFEITRTKAVSGLTAVDSSRNRGWFSVFESYQGAWQLNDTLTIDNILTHPTVRACVTLIASDVAKMRVRLVQDIGNDVWVETDSPSFSPVLRKPNRFQTMQQLIQQWELSALIHGNAYVLLARNDRHGVNGMFVLDPCRVKPLVAPDGSVYYELKIDPLAEVRDNVVVPASEIVHDRMDPLYHPLVGIAPIQAAWLAAKQGLSIQASTTQFHQNGAMPGGILVTPAQITQDQADALKASWETNYGGDNYGKIAVLGGGLDFKPIEPMKAADAQVAEQLKWGDEAICRVYHVPAYMVGVGPQPNYSNVEALNRQYYSQCLGEKVVAIENLLDIGLGLAPDKVEGKRLGVEFNKDDLWQMDTATLIASEDNAKQLKTPNESRRRLNLPPVPGGDTVYRQEQDHSLAALSKRDAREDPFASATPPPAAPVAPDAPPVDAPVPEKSVEADLARAGAEFRKALEELEHVA
jgi:HK97 family phage portal protein